MKINALFISVMVLLNCNALFAHALWIETSPTGKVGQTQEVRIFYGEFAHNERDSIAKWYSNVKDFTIWLVGPDKQKVQLTKTAGVNFFQTDFTPKLEGAYSLVVSHTAKDLGGTTKYEFLTSADVLVGKSAKLDIEANSNALKVCLNKVETNLNASVEVSAYLNQLPAKDKSLTIMSPEGWTKEIKLDENGKATFKAFWPGRYLLEVSNYEKSEGEHEGKNYKAIWQGATYSIVVK